MFARIRAVSSYLPETVEKNADLIDKRVIKKIGVIERHVVAQDEAASDLAVKAAEKLFDEYKISRDDTEFILLCVQHPDYLGPHTAAQIQDRLKLSKNVGSMDISLGCSGYIYGLATAKGLIETGLVKNILLITSSVYTKYINAKDLAIRPLFGDGATATWIEAVDEPAENIRAFVFGTDGARFDKLYIPVGGSKFMPRDNPEIFETDEGGNVHSNYEIHMDGSALAYFTMHEIPKLIDDVLDKAKLTRADLDYCIFHQANKLMLEYLQKKAELENVPYFNDISKSGNLISGSVPYAIEQVIKSVAPARLRKVLLTGFGVGLSWAGCIVDLSKIFQR